MAPEIFDRDYHWEADMWSLGIMLYQLYARRFPYWRTYEQCRHAKLDEVAELVADHPIRFDYGPWLSMSTEGREFMERCLIRDYGQRMTVTEALSHDWLNQWLPEDDFGTLDMSLDSLGTSSDEEDMLTDQHRHLYAQQRQQQQQCSQLQQPFLPPPQQQQQHVVSQPQQQQQQAHSPGRQQQVVLTSEQVQQHLVSQKSNSGQLLGQGLNTYNSSSGTDGTSAGSAGNGAPEHHQQQQGSTSVSQAQQPAAGNSITNNIVPGSRQQQQQAESAAAAVGSRKGQQ